MKKVIPVFFAVALMVTLITSPAAAIAVDPSVTGGGWIADGETIPVDTTDISLPNWLMLLDTKGISVTRSQQICHAFPGGQFGWVADIRVHTGSEWLSVPTTQGWEPDEEGTYMACADANWGTHALFGYYVKPEKTEPKFDDSVCNYDEWEIYSYYYETDEIYLEVYPGPGTGTQLQWETATYTILGEYPIPNFGIPQSGTTTSQKWLSWATFWDYSYDELPSASFIRQVEVTIGQCSQVLEWNSNAILED